MDGVGGVQQVGFFFIQIEQGVLVDVDLHLLKIFVELENHGITKLFLDAQIIDHEIDDLILSSLLFINLCFYELIALINNSFQIRQIIIAKIEAKYVLVFSLFFFEPRN